jgi:hypothetical protein
MGDRKENLHKCDENVLKCHLCVWGSGCMAPDILDVTTRVT